MKPTGMTSRRTTAPVSALRAAASTKPAAGENAAAEIAVPLGRALLLLAALLLVGGIAPQLLAVSGFAGLVVLIGRLP